MTTDAARVRLARLTTMLGRIQGPFLIAESVRNAVATKLAAGGWSYKPDYPLDESHRLDFMVLGLAVLLLPGDPTAEALAILDRLAQNGEVDGIVVLTAGVSLAVPDELHGKPVRRLMIEGTW